MLQGRGSSPQGLRVLETAMLGWEALRGQSPQLSWLILSNPGFRQVGTPPNCQGGKAASQSHLPCVPRDPAGAAGPSCLACPGDHRGKTHR